MPKSGDHNVNNIDSFFRVRPSSANVREGETISFLEDGVLVKQEKRNGVIYETKLSEQGKKETWVIRTSYEYFHKSCQNDVFDHNKHLHS